LWFTKDERTKAMIFLSYFMRYEGGNEIENISVLRNAEWKDLEELSLDCNNISNL
jgi:hypothetical protein